MLIYRKTVTQGTTILDNIIINYYIMYIIFL